MGGSKTEAPGFTTDIVRGRGFAGWGVKCHDYLCLDDGPDGRQDKVPYDTEDKARARISLIERYRRCHHPHTIVRVYHVHPGRRKTEEDGEDGVEA